MNEYQLRDDGPPEAPPLYGPIATTAVGSALVFSLPSVFGDFAVESSCALNCCLAVIGSLLSVGPLLMYRRSGGVVGPGVGFAVSLLGVFTGGIVGAIVQAKFPPHTVQELTDFAERVADEFFANLAEQGVAPMIQREEFIETVILYAPFSVLLFAAGSAVVASVVGLFMGFLIPPARRLPPGPMA